VAQGVDLGFKLQYHKKKENKVQEGKCDPAQSSGASIGSCSSGPLGLVCLPHPRLGTEKGLNMTDTSWSLVSIGVLKELFNQAHKIKTVLFNHRDC
jgi:hypothetical protein